MANRMEKTAKSHPRSTLREMSFEQLLATVRKLADARREYGEKSAKARRAAAEWAYDSGMAHDLFSRSVLAAGGSVAVDAGFDSGVMALAIDPLFAPALLTVGRIDRVPVQAPRRRHGDVPDPENSIDAWNKCLAPNAMSAASTT